MSSGHGVGSFVLVDAVTANTPSGTLTSLYSTNSTAFLLQNVEFYNIEKAIMAERRADPIAVIWPLSRGRIRLLPSGANLRTHLVACPM
ncbi:hypothetical protein KXV22_001895, partial [Aspergillus fumigatus]